MASKAKLRQQPKARVGTVEPTAEQLAETGPREPCPCGSGRRFKQCHGRDREDPADTWVARPFEGLPGECDLIALREFVAAGTATVRLSKAAIAQARDGAATEVQLCTLLPMVAPALVRADGQLLVGLQSASSSGDPSRELGQALARALTIEPGGYVEAAETEPDAPRLQDLLDPKADVAVATYDGFDFWLPEGSEEDAGEDVKAALERANAAAEPTVRLDGVDAAYWTRQGGHEFVRWVLPHDEDTTLDALARLHAAGTSSLGPDTRLLGSFRAMGVLAPVWETFAGQEPAALAPVLAELSSRLDEALAATTPLTTDERAARAGLANRQLTIR